MLWERFSERGGFFFGSSVAPLVAVLGLGVAEELPPASGEPVDPTRGEPDGTAIAWAAFG